MVDGITVGRYLDGRAVGPVDIANVTLIADVGHIAKHIGTLGWYETIM